MNQALMCPLSCLADGMYMSLRSQLDLSSNELCGVDNFGRGTYTVEGIKALSDALSINGELTTVRTAAHEAFTCVLIHTFADI